jgi:hypothetical protein
MKYILLPLAALYGLALVICLGMTMIRGVQDNGRVYSVQEAQRAVQRTPGWQDRPILVQGRLVACMPLVTEGDQPCTILAPSTCPANGRECPLPVGSYALPLMSARPNPLLARLRQVPLLGSLLPAQQELHWGQVATYRVQVKMVPNSLCGTRPCLEALLVDATP